MTKIIPDTAGRCPNRGGAYQCPWIAEEVTREQASQQPCYTDNYAKLTRDDWTLTYYYEGEMVASRSTPEGVEVLAVGPEEVRRFIEETQSENRQGVMIRHP